MNDMVWETINIKTDKSLLRRFGIIQGCVLALLGGLLLWQGKEVYLYLLIAAGVFLVAGLACPIALRPIYKVIMLAAKLIGWCITKLVLLVLFYATVFPVGFLARLCGKDFLDLKFDRQKDSYWILRKNKKTEKEDYLRQF